eukprot:TRINITY_DN5075_c0_g1_i2.p1 TRINITY_DN5075_c0_g1~~TRINITY_DN5075_c0_g1_i2.p1  ORF type:complete len:383 (+),score=111.57 TRINITY_DN5075_c0_g1_i2:1304-2452(+)
MQVSVPDTSLSGLPIRHSAGVGLIQDSDQDKTPATQHIAQCSAAQHLAGHAQHTAQHSTAHTSRHYRRLCRIDTIEGILHSTAHSTAQHSPLAHWFLRLQRSTARSTEPAGALLTLVSQGGSTEDAERLLEAAEEQKIMLEYRDENGHTAAQLALWNGQVGVLEVLLSLGASLQHEPLAVHMAVMLPPQDTAQDSTQHSTAPSQAAQTIISQYPLAAVQNTDQDGLTALHVCARRGKHHSLALIIKAYTDWLQHNTTGPTLHDVVTAKVCNLDGCIALHLAAYAPEPAASLCARALLDACVLSVRCVDNNGLSALHVAARHGSLELVQLLLQAGASKALKDGDGLLPHRHALSGPTGQTVEKAALLCVETRPPQAQKRPRPS